MIVMFEGFDSCGKTTIAKEFCKRNPVFTYCKDEQDVGLYNRKIDPELSFIYQTHRLEYMLRHNILRDAIFDRDWLSEMAYGPVFRLDRFVQFEIEKWFHHFNEKLSKYNVVIVYCHKQNITNFSDEHINISFKTQIENNYLKAFDQLLMPVIFLDTTSEDINSQLDFLTTELKRYRK
jgi:hypothetical protein